MDTNQKISLVLLIGRLVTVYFSVRIIRIQYGLRNINDKFDGFRNLLLTLSFVILLGNMVPILIDVFGIFGKGSLGLLLAYVFSNNITSMLAAFMLWQVYKMGGKDAD